MTRHRFIKTLSALCAVLASGSLAAAPGHANYEGVEATQVPFLASSSKTILDQAYTYPTGVPLIKSYTVTIAAGKSTDIHRHSVPVLAYVVSGQMEVDYGTQGKRMVSAGESYVEAINWCHQARAAGGKPVKILVSYLGQAEGDSMKSSVCTKLE
jgi:quercetin dioxygenase-like cupin family protein